MGGTVETARRRGGEAGLGGFRRREPFDLYLYMADPETVGSGDVSPHQELALLSPL